MLNWRNGDDTLPIVNENVVNIQGKSLLQSNNTERLHPITYQWAWNHYLNSVKNRWHWNEVGFGDDIAHLNSKERTRDELKIIELSLGWLANQDNLVMDNVLTNLYDKITNVECRLFLAEQGACEALHSVAYWNINESLGLDHDRINALWGGHPKMVAKADWSRERLNGLDGGDERKLLKSIVAFGCCVEGLEIMSSFVLLLALRRQNLFPGIATTVNWIMRDETNHAMFAIDLANAIKRENPTLWDRAMTLECRAMIGEAVQLEVDFIRSVMGNGMLGLSPITMEKYVRHLGQRRAHQIGAMDSVDIPMPEEMRWVDAYAGRKEENFFEQTVTEYAIGSLDWSS